MSQRPTMVQAKVQVPKNTLLAYVLWFFLGGIGVHRFYLGRIGSGVTMLLLTLIGSALTFWGIGIILLAAVGLWWIIDAFLIPGMVRSAGGMNTVTVNVTLTAEQASAPTTDSFTQGEGQ